MQHSRRPAITLGGKKHELLPITAAQPSYTPPEPEEPGEYFTRSKPKPSLCCAIISLVAVFVTIGALGLVYSHASEKTDARLSPLQTIRETRQIGDITVESIDFRSRAEHGKQIVGLPDIPLSRIVSYQVCCSYESSKTLQCQGLGSQILSQGSDQSSSKLELVLGDSRNLDSNCRIVLWLK